MLFSISMNDLIRTGDPRETGHEPRPSAPDVLKGDVYGDCDIGGDWQSFDDLRENTALLPEDVQMAIFGKAVSDPDCIIYNKPRVDSIVDIHHLFDWLSVPEHAAQEARETMERGVLEARYILSAAIIDFLRRDLQLFRGWRHQLDRGKTSKVIQEGMATMMRDFWNSGKAPGISHDELKVRQEEFQEEIRRIEGLKSEVSHLHDEISERHRRAKTKHLKKQLEEEMKALYGALVIDPWDPERRLVKKGRRPDWDAQIELQKDGLHDIKRALGKTAYIEQLFAQLKSQLKIQEIDGVWLDASDMIRDEELTDLWLAAVLDWLDEAGEIQGKDLAVQRRIDVLKKRFVEAYQMLENSGRAPGEQTSTVQHAQMILRRLLDQLKQVAVT